MKPSKKHTHQREGGRGAPIEIADSPEPAVKPEPAPEEDGLDEFIVKDLADCDETREYQSEIPDIQSESSEDRLLEDLPDDNNIDDDRPIAQNLRPRTGQPTDYKHCYEESIRKNHVYSNGKLVPWDEGDTDNEDGDFEQSEGEEYLDDEGEDYDGADDMWGEEVNGDLFTTNPEDMDDTIVSQEPVYQRKERLPRTPTQRKRRTALSPHQQYRTRPRRTQVDRHTTNAGRHEPDLDSQFMLEGGLNCNLLEGSPVGGSEQHSTSTPRLRPAEAASSANSKRRRTQDAGQRDVRTMLLRAERPPARHREQVTATATHLAQTVLPNPHPQFEFNMASYNDMQSGLPTPPTSTLSASMPLLDTTAPLTPQYPEDPDIDDEDTTTTSATILRLRQQLADLTAQLAVERSEHTDLQRAYDGMARQCARLRREVGQL